MKTLLALSFFFLTSCQSTKKVAVKVGNCSTATGFAIMDAGIKPIEIISKVEGNARVPVQIVTWPIQLVVAGGGLVVGAPFVVVGAVLANDF